MSELKFAVLGAGAGGQSMAAILAAKGCSVKVYDINAEKIARLQELGKITVTGKIEVEGSPELFTTDIGAAMADVDAIMVVSTTDGHKDIAHKIAPYLRDGQVILLNPGHVGGAMEVSHIIRQELGCTAKVIIAEAGDLMYACRISETGFPFHSGLKKKTEVAALPASDTQAAVELLQPYFPNLVAAKNVLETGFEGGGAMLHPIPTLMNIVKTDAQTPYDYYMEGVTPSVAKLVERADKERLAVCRALGLDGVPSLVKSLQGIYGLTQDDLYDLLQHNKAYVGVKCPMDLYHRFLVEDTLCGIVPLASVGKELGVDTTMMDAFIDIASTITGRDFRAEGRTAQQLGLAGKTKEEIYEMIS